MVKLPYNLGMAVRDSITKYRRKNNIPEPEELKKIYNKQTDFLDDELSLVREIVIDKKSLEYINLFPNITSIIIDGSDELDSAEIKNVISSFPNLESLSIYGQDKLQYLDVSSLTKMKDLKLVSNKGLHRIVGADKLDELSNFVFYDNQTYLTIPELCNSVAEMSKNGVQCDFDVLYMQHMLQSNRNFDSNNLKWSEAVGLASQGNKLQYSTEELKKAVDKAREIVNLYIKPTDTLTQKYAILYQWMCENIRYDHEAIDNNYTHSFDGKNQGLVGGTNGTVNGLVYGNCVCEGYSKSMQLLLRMCDIPSFDIGCIAEDKSMNAPMINIDGKKKTNIGDHSIIKVNLDGKIYYSDITWDASSFQKGYKRDYFLLSKADMQKDHKLIGEEYVSTSFKSVSPDEQQELLNYAKGRIVAVSEEKKNFERRKPKENTEIIAEVNKDLIAKRQKYGIVATQIEELMIQNQKSSIPDYEQKLALLMQQRDEISESIGQLMSYQSTLQNNINYDKEEKFKNSIFQVERLLGIHITATNGYSVDPQRFDGVPQVISKSTVELAKEQGLVIGQLNDLWLYGELDLKNANRLKDAVRTKYQQMISSAPKPAKGKVDTKDKDLDERKEEMGNTNLPLNKPNHPKIKQSIIFEKTNEREIQIKRAIEYQRLLELERQKSLEEEQDHGMSM